MQRNGGDDMVKPSYGKRLAVGPLACSLANRLPALNCLQVVAPED